MELNLIDCTEAHKKKKGSGWASRASAYFLARQDKRGMLASAQDQERVVCGPVRGVVNVVELQILHKSWKWALSIRSCAVKNKKSKKKHDARAKLLFCSSKTIAFLPFLLLSQSSLPHKLPNFLIMNR